MTRRHYSSAAAATTLSSGVTSGATSIDVAAVTGFPVSYPYTLILDPETASEEVVTVTAGAGTNLTVTRGDDGTTALSHTSGAVVKHGVSARDFDEPNEHIDNTDGVHGVTGDVVGTTDTQTLTDKTIDLTDNTLVGTLAEFSAAVSDADLVGVATTQTLTGKTLTAPELTDPTASGSLAGFGDAWTVHEPNPTQGAATTTSSNDGAYEQVGKRVSGDLRCVFSGGGTVGNDLVVALPSAPVRAAGYLVIGTFVYRVAASGAVYTGAVVSSGGVGVKFQVSGQTGLLGTAPSFQVAAGDTLSFDYRYEAA